MIRILMIFLICCQTLALRAGEFEITTSTVESTEQKSLGQRIKQGFRDWWYKNKPLPAGGTALVSGEEVSLPGQSLEKPAKSGYIETVETGEIISGQTEEKNPVTKTITRRKQQKPELEFQVSQ